MSPSLSNSSDNGTRNRQTDTSNLADHSDPHSRSPDDLEDENPSKRPRLPLGKDDCENDETERLRAKFMELHPTMHGESFSSFREAAKDVRLVGTYLAKLEKFRSLLPGMNRSYVDQVWQQFIQRKTKSQSLAQDLRFLGNTYMIDMAVELAFLWNHPQYHGKTEISKTTMLEAVEAKNQDEACAILEARSKEVSSPGKDDSEDSQTKQLREKFIKLHLFLYEREAEEHFISFRKVAGDELVSTYLAQLEEFYRDVRNDGPLQIRLAWPQFILREKDSQDLAKKISFDANMMDRAIKLAFLWRHPQYDSGTEISTMRQAVEAKTDKEARAILEARSKNASSSTVSSDIIKKGYNSPFLRFDEIIKPMLASLDEYTKKWQDTEYLAPYAALIGPSMSGKSRSLIEMAQHICVIYVCLRSTDSTGYPPRSALAEHMLPQKLSNLTYHSALLAGIFQVAANFFNKQDMTADVRVRLNQWNDYTEVASLGTLDWAERTQQRFTDDVLAEMKKFDNSMEDPLVCAINAMSDSTGFVNKNPLKVLLVLDEARALLTTPESTLGLSLFHTLRRTIMKTPEKAGFFTILVNTTFNVANFSRASKFDPSARHGFVGRNLLYPPLYEIASLDAMVPPEPPKSWEELVSPGRLFKYGSPVFGTYFCDASAEENAVHTNIHHAILELAHFKLLGRSEPTWPKSLTKAQAFAFLGPTIQPRLSAAYDLNTELIASHAAHCDHINPDCDMVLSNYPSQFTLAAAAVRFLTDDGKLVQCIKALTAAVL
ncbi:hypothetical protein PTTG_28286 [Puccinia triticina 1-1 BBBD Race 1]|uniref:Uncharacterized protein n=1 Tax=Puccinia triticina (isolate 1-1 / race 1 (BBBD)) TaxID=630390 RepID=A0A180GF47_PUCT1|nr:hypothetical protein PTTG_28286 [Puccinia triticina 1-1 BBBD Race 1]